MAFGQTLVVATVLTLLQWLVFAATALAMPAAAGEMLAAGLFAVPYNWIICGTENLLFLFYPSPLVPTGSEGVEDGPRNALHAGQVPLLPLPSP